MANLILEFSDLYNEVLKMLGTYNSGSPSATDLAEAKFIVNRAYLRLLNFKDWEFTNQEGTLTTVAGQWEYELPESFNYLTDQNIYYEANSGYDPIVRRTYNALTAERAYNSNNSYPIYFATMPAKYETHIGEGWKLGLFPTPDADYILKYFYNIIPTKLVSDTDSPIGGASISDCLLELSLAYAEAFKDGVKGIHNSVIADIIGSIGGIDKRRKSSNLGKESGGRFITDRDLAERTSFNLFDTGETL